MERILKKFLTVSLLLTLFVFNISPTSAIYNASSESRFLYAGFIFVEKNDGTYGQCGINYISGSIGITAAHCLEGVTKVYAGIGNYDNQKFKQKAVISTDFSISSDYNESSFSMYPGLGDVGVVKFLNPIKLSEYATITSPQEGCGYFLIGYGQNESNVDLERRSIDICLKNFTDYSFELEFGGNQHFCNGDSGSGIYKKGTNELVGTVSAFYTEFGELSCVGASAYIATRMDSNMDFIKRNIPINSYDINENNDIKILPDNYFEEYHPETKNPDGTGYNYNNDIEVKIEELSSMFDDIYPEEGIDNQNTDTIEYSNPYKDPETGQYDHEKEIAEALNQGGIILGSILFTWCIVCGVILVIVSGVVFLVIKLLKSKK